MIKILTTEMARSLLFTCLEMAREGNESIAVAVVDAGGNLLIFERECDAFLATIDIAIAKAKTANAFKRTTAEMQQKLEQGKASYLSLPNAVVLEGGVPIFIGSHCVGGLGVCGAPSAVDHRIATAAISSFNHK